jgi:beta-xylosidase
MKRTKNRMVRYLTGLTLFCLALFPVASAKTPKPAQRDIEIDVAQATKPLDRFFDLSVGSDFPGTLIRDDSQLQLKKAVDELGFRYICFHAIFHDVLGTVRIENGKTIYDWTKIDQLYDDLLARRIKPFVELGFTPNAMKTSDNKIFYWQRNTSHPLLPAWRDLVKNLSSGSYRLEIQRTGFRTNDAYSAYIDMGAPRSLTATQLDQLNWLTRDLKEINRVVKVGKKGSYAFSLPMRSNDVVLVTVEKVAK